jgi:hypothetical protein
MKQTTKEKIRKTSRLLAGPAIVLYVILTFVFITYEPQRFVTVPNPCKSLCYDYIIGQNDWGQTAILGIEHYPETIQKEVDYMGIGDYMLMIPLISFLAVLIGLVIFVIGLWAYRSIKGIIQSGIAIWKA